MLTSLRAGIRVIAPWLVVVACVSVGAARYRPGQHPAPPARAGGAWAQSVPTAGRTVYVDQQVADTSCTTYSMATRSCTGGAAVAFSRLQDASSAVRPGDTVLIRAGVFTTQFSPARSGAVGAYVTFATYPNETVTFTGVDGPALYLRNRSYLRIEGLTVTDVVGWGRLEDAHNNVIVNNRFSAATARGTTGGLKLVRSRHNTIVGNTFDHGHDSVVIQDSDRNVIEGNTFTWARHSLLSVRCSSFNVIRNNRFHNERQKAAEIYDCEAVSDAPYKLDATRRNVFEWNTFSHTRGSSEHHRYNGIQYAGQQGIVRFNVFHDNQGGALNLAVYPSEALHNYGHRIYHNTFYANRCFALIGSRDLGRKLPSVVRNNLLYRNTDCSGVSTQILVGDPKALVLTNNAILRPSEDPRFVDEERRDLRLQPESPLLGKGTFLTKTVGTESGTAMRVDDIWYFYDGYGIQGAVGDMIQLEGSGLRATVVAIDYPNGILTLDRALSWRDGQGVGLMFEGHAPSMGAHESTTRPRRSPG